MAVFVSCSRKANLEAGYEMLGCWRRGFPGLFVIAGGSAFSADEANTLSAGATYVPHALTSAKDEILRELRRSRRRTGRTIVNNPSTVTGLAISPGRPAEAATSQKMKMNVVNRLAGRVSMVEDEPVAVLAEMPLARDLTGPGDDPAQRFAVALRHGIDAGDVAPGNEENVRWRLWIDVFEMPGRQGHRE